MNTTHLSAGAVCGALLLSLVIVGDARAQSSDDALAAIQFPVAELGNCGSKEACKTYCDDSAHIEACIAFAEKHNLMPQEEIEVAKKFIAAGAKGPGGCTGKDSCEAYCNNIEHIDACVAFAEENRLMPPDELQEAKKVQAAIKSGAKPPACRTKKECDAFCESPDNMPACIEFAKAAGLMSPEEQADADKMLQAMRAGAKPPACRGREECEAYCAKDEHIEECVAFGKAAGYITEEESEMFRKTRGKGPGGCRGKEACDAFCTSSAENEELCINFQVENGLMSEERKQQMEGDKQKMRDSFSNMPPEVASCLSEKLGADTVEKLTSGEQRMTRAIGETMPECFRQFEEQRIRQESGQGQMMQRPGGEDGQSPQGEYSGPRPPEGTYPMPPEGAYRCEGENCSPPEGAYYPPPEGSYQRPPEGAYPMPEGGAVPAPEEYSSETSAVTEPAPATDVAPAPEPSSSITPESLSGAVILFLQSLGFAR